VAVEEEVVVVEHKQLLTSVRTKKRTILLRTKSAEKTQKTQKLVFLNFLVFSGFYEIPLRNNIRNSSPALKQKS
jgi:hypothetical protein